MKDAREKVYGIVAVVLKYFIDHDMSRQILKRYCVSFYVLWQKALQYKAANLTIDLCILSTHEIDKCLNNMT
jgi:hypothetical protein